MKKYASTSLWFLGIVFSWMNLGHASDLHAQTRKPEQDFNTLQNAENNNPVGLWSDSTTMWVADGSDDKIYAYVLATKERDAEKNFETLPDWENPGFFNFWSDGTTMWVARGDEDVSDKIYAYDLATKKRDADKDFETLATAFLTDLWSNNTTVWVADLYGDKLYAYVLATKERDASKDLTLAEENGQPFGLWSNDTTMWVADFEDKKIYAYSLATKARDVDKDFNTLAAAGNSDLSGLWSDGTTMWVSDLEDEKIYAYAFPKVSEKSLSVNVENTGIRVWPNPVATQLNISSESRGKLSVTLRNLAGQKLQEGEFEGKGQMDVSRVPAGVYLLYIRTAEETISYLIYKE